MGLNLRYSPLEYTNAKLEYDGKLMEVDTMSPASGFAGATAIYKSSVIKLGDVIKTEILIDLTSSKSMTTDLDIIGLLGPSHIGQITAAKNGTLLYGQMSCWETPAGGVVDVDLYSATEGTGEFDGGVGSLTETAAVTSSADWTGTVTPVIVTGLPVADSYLYLTSGKAGTTGTYSAGRFFIEFWGV